MMMHGLTDSKLTKELFSMSASFLSVCSLLKLSFIMLVFLLLSE